MVNNIKLKGKILLAFLVIVVCATIVATVGLNRMRIIDDNYSVLIKNYGFSQGDLGRAIISLTQANSHAHNAVTYEEKEDIKNAKASMEEEIKTYKEEIKKVGESFSDGVGKKEYEEASKLAEDYLKINEEFIEYCFDLDTSNLYDFSKVEKKMVEELDPAYEVAYKALNELLDIKVTEGDAQSEDITSTNNKTYIIALIFSMIILASAVFVSFVSHPGLLSLI